MSVLDEREPQRAPNPDIRSDRLRAAVLTQAKAFKTSWTKLGQALYPVWQDKHYYAWGYDKFEHYAQRELGIRPITAMKLLKSYFFLEQEEPAYLKDDFAQTREAGQIPDYETVNVLRLARRRKELDRDDYLKIKQAAFDKGRDAPALRKELTALIKQRQEVDPDEEREKRSLASIRRCLNALTSFKKDMETLKLAPAEILEEVEDLIKRLNEQVEEAE